MHRLCVIHTSKSTALHNHPPFQSAASWLYWLCLCPMDYSIIQDRTTQAAPISSTDYVFLRGRRVQRPFLCASASSGSKFQAYLARKLLETFKNFVFLNDCTVEPTYKCPRSRPQRGDILSKLKIRNMRSMEPKRHHDFQVRSSNFIKSPHIQNQEVAFPLRSIKNHAQEHSVIFLYTLRIG